MAGVHGAFGQAAQKHVVEVTRTGQENATALNQHTMEVHAWDRFPNPSYVEPALALSVI